MGGGRGGGEGEDRGVGGEVWMAAEMRDRGRGWGGGWGAELEKCRPSLSARLRPRLSTATVKLQTPREVAGTGSGSYRSLPSQVLMATARNSPPLDPPVSPAVYTCGLRVITNRIVPVLS